jgi:hypothetical protein
MRVAVLLLLRLLAGLVHYAMSRTVAVPSGLRHTLNGSVVVGVRLEPHDRDNGPRPGWLTKRRLL